MFATANGRGTRLEKRLPRIPTKPCGADYARRSVTARRHDRRYAGDKLHAAR
jgi:hypothetical protein